MAFQGEQGVRKASPIFEAVAAVIERILSLRKQYGLVLPGLLIILLISILGYIRYQEWVFLLAPFIVLAAIWGMLDFRRVYLLMWALIPFSIEVDLPGGLSTDFPAEPLMWLSCILLTGYVYLYHRTISLSFIFHPVFIVLLIHFFWIIISTIISNEPIISLKYTVAKSWYLICFIAIPLILFKSNIDFRKLGMLFLISLIATIMIIIFRHSQYGFTFETINKAVIPIYRNHVDYACCLAIVLPYVWLLRSWFTGNTGKIFFLTSMVLMVTGIYFSYTRTAWLCIPVAVMVYFIIKFNLVRIVIPLALAITISVIAWLAYDNTYLQYSPDYEKAITHKKFDDLVSATYKMEDISTVERFYRWVAGYYMIKENPFTGFGPATFYTFYHSYVDRHFTTYVSDNPERSGMHNYYLMVAVEQGLIGLAIFLLLLIIVLVYGEKIYHRLQPGPEKQLLMAALVSFCCALFVLTLNDMVETDKVGSFFFLSIAIVILLGTQKTILTGRKDINAGGTN